MNTLTQTPAPVKPDGSVRLLTPPVYPCELLPSGAPGEVVIRAETQKGTVEYFYLLLPLCDEHNELQGYRLKKHGCRETYDVQIDTEWNPGYTTYLCDCFDYLHRHQHDDPSDPKSGCKHGRAVRALRAAEKIA